MIVIAMSAEPGADKRLASILNKALNTLSKRDVKEKAREVTMRKKPSALVRWVVAVVVGFFTSLPVLKVSSLVELGELETAVATIMSSVAATVATLFTFEKIYGWDRT